MSFIREAVANGWAFGHIFCFVIGYEYLQWAPPPDIQTCSKYDNLIICHCAYFYSIFCVSSLVYLKKTNTIFTEFFEFIYSIFFLIQFKLLLLLLSFSFKLFIWLNLFEKKNRFYWFYFVLLFVLSGAKLPIAQKIVFGFSVVIHFTYHT